MNILLVRLRSFISPFSRFYTNVPSVGWSKVSGQMKLLIAKGRVIAFLCSLSLILTSCSGSNSNGDSGSGQNPRLGFQTQPQISLGGWNSDYGYVCAVNTGGKVLCWGYGLDGQLGHGKTEVSKLPVAVLGVDTDGDGSGDGLLSEVVQLSSGGNHVCAVNANKKVFCWGLGSSGQLGDGSTNSSHFPIAVVEAIVEEEQIQQADEESNDSGDGLLSGIISVAASLEHSCALTEDKEVFCWGSGANGVLGTGSTDNSYSPVSVVGVDTDDDGAGDGLLGGVTQMALADKHSCVLTEDSGVLCWGEAGEAGRLGNGTETDSLFPTAVLESADTPLTGITQISTERNFTCALKADGGVLCWGSGVGNRLGNGDTANQLYPVVALEDSSEGIPLSGVKQVSVAAYHTCVLKGKGKSIFCWGGGNAQKQWGDTDTLGYLSEEVLQLDSSFLSNCAIKVSGDIFCWGAGSKGQLGTGASGKSEFPIDVEDSFYDNLYGIIGVSTSAHHNCVIKAGGELSCWGWNDQYQLGSGKYLYSIYYEASPVLFDKNGLGGGSYDPLSGVTQVSAGLSHTCALVTNEDITGGAFCWGGGANGQLGRGHYYDSFLAVSVLLPDGSDFTPINNLTQITTSVTHSCALTSGREVVCWGDGSHGQLGNGSNDGSTTPSLVVEVVGSETRPATSFKGILHVSAGESHTCALKEVGGTVFCWGEASSGRLGSGGRVDSNVPVPVISALDNVSPLTGIGQISVGLNHTCALEKLGGEVVCWGFGDSGRLGNGHVQDAFAPVKVLLQGKVGQSPLNNVTNISAGVGHSCALRGEEGKVFCWGEGSYGRLGSGGVLGSLFPLPVTGIEEDTLSGVTQVHAGWNHTCALRNENPVCWGANDYGQLGFGAPSEGSAQPFRFKFINGEKLLNLKK